MADEDDVGPVGPQNRPVVLEHAAVAGDRRRVATVLHPSRYMLQAAPFLIPDSPLWLHRLWQILLWLGMTFASSALLTLRLAINDALKSWVFLAWSFLFLLIRPVY